MSITNPIPLNIANKLKNKSYFQKFFEVEAQLEIATQIRELREKRKLRQVDFAEKAEMKQSAVSRIEQEGYSSWNFKTLLRVAKALDARLKVLFVPMEEVIQGYEAEASLMKDLDEPKTQPVFAPPEVSRNRPSTIDQRLKEISEERRYASNRYRVGTSGVALPSIQTARRRADGGHSQRYSKAI